MEKTIVYIRHAEKEYNNNGSDLYSHDAPLKEGQDFERLRDELIELYGVPSKVFASPYQRTFDTAKELTPLEDDVIVDCNVSEHISKKKSFALSTKYLSQPTIERNPPFHDDLDSRIVKHMEYMKELPDGVYWVVSHGTIIKKILELKKKPEVFTYKVIRYSVFEEERNGVIVKRYEEALLFRKIIQ